MMAMLKKVVFAISILMFLVSSDLLGQDPLRFEEEVAKLVDKYSSHKGEHIVLFTGSSSIRFWGTLEKVRPAMNFGQFDYKKYLASRGIHYVFKAYGTKALRLTRYAPPPPLGIRLISLMRNKIQNLLEMHYSGEYN